MFKYQQPSASNNFKSYWKIFINGLMLKECANVIEATDTARTICRYGGMVIRDYTVLPNSAMNSRINYQGLAVSIIWMTLYTWSTFYALINQQTVLGIFYKTKMKYHGELITAIMSFVFLYYAIIILSISNEEKSEFWEELLKLDDTLGDLGIKDDFRKFRMDLLQVIIGVTIMEGIHFFGIYFTFSSWNLEMPLCKVFHMVCNFHIMMFCLIQYYFCLLLLSKRFGKINDILLTATETKRHIVSHIIVKKAADQMKGRLHNTSAYHETRALDKINIASKLYAKMYAIGVANDIRFGKIIVMMISVSFISIILSMFYLMEATAGGLYRDIRRYLFFFSYNFQEIALGMFVIFFIVSASEKVYTQAKRTAHITHDIINHQISEEITKTAACLSMQLLHQRHTFSAYGLFNLERSLLLSVLGSVTTYLIILLQFATGTTIDDMFDQVQVANTTLIT